MNQIWHRLLFVGAAIGLALPMACRATDTANYVFKVPVNISNMGPGNQVSVVCKTGRGGFVSATLESARVPVPLDASGSFNGTVDVRVDYGPVKGGYLVIQDMYQCDLQINVDANGVMTRGMPPSLAQKIRVGGSL